MTTPGKTLCYARDPSSNRVCAKEVDVGQTHAGPHVWKTLEELVKEGGCPEN